MTKYEVPEDQLVPPDKTAFDEFMGILYDVKPKYATFESRKVLANVDKVHTIPKETLAYLNGEEVERVDSTGLGGKNDDDQVIAERYARQIISCWFGWEEKIDNSFRAYFDGHSSRVVEHIGSPEYVEKVKAAVEKRSDKGWIHRG